MIINGIHIGLIAMSISRLKRYIKITNRDITIPSDYTKPISILVPAYNEQETIIDNINSLLELEYPQFEILVINDGSKDETLKRVVEHFNLRKIDYEVNYQVECNRVRGVYSSFNFPNLVVVDKENGGKSDALNAGINVSRYPLFCGIDADCIIERDALLRIVKPFLKNEETIAVGGIVRIANGCIIEDGKVIDSRLPRKNIVKFQIVEYFRAFLTSRLGWEGLNGLLIISGAFGLFKKTSVIKVGGYRKTIGEDMELTLRMHKHFRSEKIPYKIDYASDAVCWTQAPDNFSGLKTQRVRWQRGLIDSLWKHKTMFLNPKYGMVGMASMPYFVLVEMLGPIIELFGYLLIVLALAMGILSRFFVYVFLLAFLYGILFSLFALLIEQFSYKRYKHTKDISLLIFYALIEQFYYRQLTVVWRIQAFMNYRKGSKQWGSIKRSSFHERG